jgi:hypothetical protein
LPVLWLIPALSAGTLTWTGGSPDDDNWSAAANWSPARVPTAGDTLIFPGLTPDSTPHNDLVGLSIEELIFQASEHITGNEFGVTRSVDGAGAVTIDNGIRCEGDVGVTNGGVLLELKGPIRLNHFGVILLVASAHSPITTLARVEGSGWLSLLGPSPPASPPVVRFGPEALQWEGGLLMQGVRVSIGTQTEPFRGVISVGSGSGAETELTLTETRLGEALSLGRGSRLYASDSVVNDLYLDGGEVVVGRSGGRAVAV